MQHFHRPENRNNRFMASLTEQERAILRDFERPALYSTKQQQQSNEQQGEAWHLTQQWSMPPVRLAGTHGLYCI
jgi:hypothetical protein